MKAKEIRDLLVSMAIGEAHQLGADSIDTLLPSTYSPVPTREYLRVFCNYNNPHRRHNVAPRPIEARYAGELLDEFSKALSQIHGHARANDTIPPSFQVEQMIVRRFSEPTGSWDTPEVTTSHRLTITRVA